MKLLITVFTMLCIGFTVAIYGQSTPQIRRATDAEFAREQDEALRRIRESQGIKLHEEKYLSGDDKKLPSQNVNYATEKSALSRDKLLELANRGDSTAQFNLGYMYEMGTNGYPNKNLAIKWYKKAEAQGNLTAKTRLISLSGDENGNKSPQSEKKGFLDSALRGIGVTAKVVFAVAEAVSRQEARNQEYMNEQRGKAGSQGYQRGLPTYLEYKDDGLCYYDDGTVTKIGIGLCPLVK